MSDMKKGFSYISAEKKIPEMKAMRRTAESKATVFSKEEYELLYEALHGEDPELAQMVRTKLIETHMYMVTNFMKGFTYTVPTAQDMQDLLSDGFLALAESVDKWDIKRGDFPACVYCNLLTIYRKYWKIVDVRPETILQTDKSIASIEYIFRNEVGRLPSNEELAELTGLSAGGIKKSRERSRQYTRLQSLDEIDWTYGVPKIDLIASEEPSAEEQALKPMLESILAEDCKRCIQELQESCKELKGQAQSVENMEILLQEFLDESKEFCVPSANGQSYRYGAAGKEMNYQQIYRARTRLAATLVYYGVINVTPSERLIPWLQKEVEVIRKRDRKNKIREYRAKWGLTRLLPDALDKAI